MPTNRIDVNCRLRGQFSSVFALILTMYTLLSCGTDEKKEVAAAFPATGEFKKLNTSNAPAARRGAIVIEHSDQVYLLGGKDDALGGNELEDGGIYSLLNDTWQPFPSLADDNCKKANRDQSLLSVQGGVIIFCEKAPRYNLFVNDNDKTVTISQPTPNDWQSQDFVCAASNGVDAIVLGNNKDDETEAMIFNGESGEWTILSNSGLHKIDNTASCRMSEEFFMVWGGLDPQTSLTTQKGAIFSLTNREWSDVSTTDAPVARFSADISPVKDGFIISGGCTFKDGATSCPVNDDYARIFNPKDNRWTSLDISTLPTLGSGVIFGIGTVAFGIDEWIVFWGTNFENYIWNSASNTWHSFPSEGNPGTRANAMVTATRQGLFIWGGTWTGEMYADGVVYSP